MNTREAVCLEVQRRIKALEQRSYRWYEFRLRRNQRTDLQNYRKYLESFQVQTAQLTNLPVYDPLNPEHVALVDMLASPETHDA